MLLMLLMLMVLMTIEAWCVVVGIGVLIVVGDGGGIPPCS
jgi:hypothetical protein